ncbi:MAG: hypothetical protein AAFQ44_04490 [Pseudomonadota bacterium]
MVTEPNWLALLGLIYLGFAFMFFAIATGQGASMVGYGAERRAVAAAHQKYGINFASLLALIGLGLQAASQFMTLAFGSEIVMGLGVLMALLTVSVFAADYFAEPNADEFPEAQTLTDRFNVSNGQPTMNVVSGHLAA